MTPQEIATGAKCFACLPDQQAAMLYLLNQIRIAQGGEAMTPQEIASASVCFACIPDYQAAVTYLLSEIVE